jgi:hypothetical protein
MLAIVTANFIYLHLIVIFHTTVNLQYGYCVKCVCAVTK